MEAMDGVVLALAEGEYLCRKIVIVTIFLRTTIKGSRVYATYVHPVGRKAITLVQWPFHRLIYSFNLSDATIPKGTR